MNILADAAEGIFLSSIGLGRDGLTAKFKRLAGKGYGASLNQTYADRNLYDLSGLRISRAVQIDLSKRHFFSQRAHSLIVDAENQKLKNAARELAEGLDSVPTGFLSLTSELGVQTSFVDRISNGKYAASYHDKLRKIQIAGERVNAAGQVSVPKNVVANYLHEVGHLLDEAAGHLSLKEDVRTAYAADLDDIREGLASGASVTTADGEKLLGDYCPEIAYFLPKSLGGRHWTTFRAREESFAQIISDRLCHTSSGLVNAMPRMTALCDRVLASVEEEMKIPPPSRKDLKAGAPAFDFIASKQTPSAAPS